MAGDLLLRPPPHPPNNGSSLSPEMFSALASSPSSKCSSSSSVPMITVWASAPTVAPLVLTTAPSEQVVTTSLVCSGTPLGTGSTNLPLIPTTTALSDDTMLTTPKPPHQGPSDIIMQESSPSKVPSPSPEAIITSKPATSVLTNQLIDSTIQKAFSSLSP